MEIYEDWLSSKMTRAEFNELCDDDKKERKRLQKIKYREENSEQLKEYEREYREENSEKHKEYHKEYHKTTIGKKVHTLARWKQRGLQETKEELDIIYDLYLHQELCYSCDCILTRNGIRCATDPCMDHDHTTNKFRQICCRSCNCQDRWMQYWC